LDVSDVIHFFVVESGVGVEEIEITELVGGAEEIDGFNEGRHVGIGVSNVPSSSHQTRTRIPDNSGMVISSSVPREKKTLVFWRKQPLVG